MSATSYCNIRILSTYLLLSFIRKHSFLQLQLRMPVLVISTLFCRRNYVKFSVTFPSQFFKFCEIKKSDKVLKVRSKLL